MFARCLLPSVLLASMAFAQSSWLEFNAGASENSSPLVQFNGTWDSFLTFDIELRGLLAETATVDSQDYLRFSGSPGTVPADSVGYPELPVVRRMVWLPDDSDITLEYSASCCEGIECLPIYPAPLDSLVQDSTCTPYIGEYFRLDSAAYASEEWYPEVQAELVGEFRLRDLRVGIVDVYPVQFLASEDSLRVWSDIEISLSWDEGNAVWSEAGLGHYDNLIGDNLLGYTPEVHPINDGTGSVVRVYANRLVAGPGYAPDYVILVAAGLDGQDVTGFANYRAGLNGFKVAIVRTDDVLECYGGEETVLTSGMIREFTEDMWEWGEGPGDRPIYLLLIGDHEDAGYAQEDWFLPTHVTPVEPNSIWEWANDSWYVLFDEDRSTLSAPPDMIVGRLPARDMDNLGNMLDVITDFESEASWPPPSSLSWRRYLTRLSGQNATGVPPTEYRYDIWEPDAEWTSSFANWLGYDFDNLNCGDGDDEDDDDGSDVTAHEWVDTLVDWFERGQQVAFYSNHGETHMFSAGLQWEPDPPMIVVPADFGAPDSVFDVMEAAALGFGTISHAHPFVISLSCLNGTFNHTLEQHEYSDGSGGHYECMHFDTHHEPPHWDYGTDCLAEAWVKNTESGAIGVFASSEVSQIVQYNQLGTSLLRAIYEDGITRQGDAICSGRLACLDQYFTSSGWSNELGRFNLMGDPAVDIGDRVKFRGRCDLSIAPSDLRMDRYPTMSIGSEGTAAFQAVVHNFGASSSGQFRAEMEVQWGQQTETLVSTCQGLAPGAQATIRFDWDIPQGFTTPATVSLHATADPQNRCPDSWTANNDASAMVTMCDLYPNEAGWPVQTQGSVKAPPCLADIDGDGDLEIIVAEGIGIIAAYDPDSPGDPVWIAYPYVTTTTNGIGYSIPAVGELDGDASPEIAIETIDGLTVLDGLTGEKVCFFPHDLPAGAPGNGRITPVVADVWPGNGRNEVCILREYSGTSDAELVALTADHSGASVLDAERITTGNVGNGIRCWLSAANMRADGTAEVLVYVNWLTTSPVTHHSGLWVYDYDENTSSAGIVDSRTWTELPYSQAIATPATGRLPDGMRIALPRIFSNSSMNPVWVLDAGDLSQSIVECQRGSSETSSWICQCLLADWDALIPGLDRIVAPAENQSFSWESDGDNDWFSPYWGSEDVYLPPFGALGDIDGDGTPDLLVGTRTGMVQAFGRDGYPLGDLGFPYVLPSEVFGGFCIADIDQDGKVEVVFGTMDNYLHIWELGTCSEGYAPWPQCQHDAARTSALQ